jgi:hypothetical protein
LQGDNYRTLTEETWWSLTINSAAFDHSFDFRDNIAISYRAPAQRTSCPGLKQGLFVPNGHLG